MRDERGLCFGVQLVLPQIGIVSKTGKGWTKSLLPPRWDATVVSLGGSGQEKRTRIDQLPSPVFLDLSQGYKLSITYGGGDELSIACRG